MEREIIDIIIGKFRQIPKLEFQVYRNLAKQMDYLRTQRCGSAGGTIKDPADYIAYREMMAGV